MEIEEAVNKAKQIGLGFISVNEYSDIFFHECKPRAYQTMWINEEGVDIYIGQYTGNKHWRDTLREVKK